MRSNGLGPNWQTAPDIRDRSLSCAGMERIYSNDVNKQPHVEDLELYRPDTSQPAS